VLVAFCAALVAFCAALVALVAFCALICDRMPGVNTATKNIVARVIADIREVFIAILL
jgi:hypothetical protein